MTKQEAFDAVMREKRARIEAEAAYLMVEHVDWPVDRCIYVAETLEILLYGTVYHEQPPIGLLGISPVRKLR